MIHNVYDMQWMVMPTNPAMVFKPPTPPGVCGDFVLLDSEDFNLLDGTQFELLTPCEI